MINVSNSQSHNVFKDFPDLKLGQPLVSVNSSLLTAKPDTIDVKKATADSKKIASTNVTDAENNKKGKKGGILAATVGSTVIAAGVIALFVTKGFSSVTYRRINDLIEHLNKKIADSTISQKSKSYLEKGTLNLAKGVKGFLSGLKVVANFNAMKDSFVKKMFYVTEPTKKFANGVTKLFKKFSNESMDTAYNKVQLDTEDFCANLRNHVKNLKVNGTTESLGNKINIKNGKEEIGTLLTNLETHLDNAGANFKTGFGKEVRLGRNEAREKELEELDLSTQVWKALFKDGNGGIFNFKANMDKYKSYLTEEISKDIKIKYRNEIITRRKAVTNNVEHNYSLIKTSLKEMSDKLTSKDTKSRDLIKVLEKDLDAYNACTGPNEAIAREAVSKKLIQNLNIFKEAVEASGENYSEKVTTAIDSQIKFILEEVIDGDKKGSIEEIMTIVNYLKKAEIIDKNTNKPIKLIDEKLAKVIDNKSKAITKSMNKASKMECEDFFDKNAEFEVGSAPSDLLGLAAPLGVAAYAISKSDDKNERVSTTLTTGIPILGSIGAAFYGTIRSFAGPKNLGFALGTGFVLNFIGSSCDKLYKSYKEKRSFTKMAVAAYKNNTMLSQVNK